MTEQNTQVRVSAKALIKDGEQYLLIREQIGNDSYWDLPGGKIEFGETAEATLVREVWEELGVKIRAGKLLGYWQFLSPRQGQIVCLTFLCQLADQSKDNFVLDSSHNPVSDENIVEAVWVDKNTLTDTAHLNNKSLRQLLAQTLP